MFYTLFISHSWTYPNAYNGLVGLLDAALCFNYKNYSVPQDDPIHNASNDTQLKEAIRKQMQPCSCVLILAGVYATYSKWINIEISLAQSMNKPIIAIVPRGAERISTTVQNAADRIVKWSTNSIVSAIREMCG